MRRWLWWGALLVLGLGVVALWWAWPREEPTLVYFVHWDEKCNTGRLAPGLRVARGRTPTERLAYALRSLLEGPNPEEQGMGYSSEIPSGTRLLGVRVERGVAYVNLSREFERGGGSASMLARVYQIVYTATRMRGVDAVQILLEGRLQETLGGEGLFIGTPLRRPPSAPEF
ncbi:MAG: GerMN domain-containing protein [Armatimonadetes bacterium]|nr:GerMN domain-containing protein [Armatimonadota bacterium]MDW8153787.1 GerMN domain-containing protein [Armatimonadota bacterium]